jgi:two-component system, cell cycle sensor histidine kinase and response regulator CckA
MDAFQSSKKGATLLIVEDEASVRDLLNLALTGFGYKVLLAGDDKEALSLWKQHAKDISLLISDLTLPTMNGLELFYLLREQMPSLKVLFLSGHFGNTMHRQIIQQKLAYLQKPFSLGELAAKVQSALE